VWTISFGASCAGIFRIQGRLGVRLSRCPPRPFSLAQEGSRHASKASEYALKVTVDTSVTPIEAVVMSGKVLRAGAVGRPFAIEGSAHGKRVIANIYGQIEK